MYSHSSFSRGGLRKIGSQKQWESAIRDFWRAGLDMSRLPTSLPLVSNKIKNTPKPKPLPPEIRVRDGVMATSSRPGGSPPLPAGPPRPPSPPLQTNYKPPVRTVEERSFGRSIRRFLSKW
ncbi:hypothetical protein B0T25DRAFT_354582 [Lasiosphaeria hispida]|uniref:Uncharacterized protein n=1 Tax=Lasiosphaeria hispida TaxID=260671 RepID=A0AAJ0H719_9PEZI|nr:hypothetical protein B0T25DRAFT_354582 [Lasiosphaeria hispida]